MSKSMYKYKSLACIYLALTIATGTFGVYKAIPTVIKNKGTVMTDVKDKLDANVNEETSVIHETDADSTDKTNVSNISNKATKTDNNSADKNTDSQHVEVEPIDLEDSSSTPNTSVTPNTTDTPNTTNNSNVTSTPSVSSDGLFTPKEPQPQTQQSQTRKPRSILNKK